MRTGMGGQPTIPAYVGMIGTTLAMLGRLPVEQQMMGLVLLTETMVATALAMSLEMEVAP